MRGVDDQPVVTVVVGRIAVWVSSAPTPPRASLEAVRRHHAVVEAAMRAVTPVPLRFGQWLDTEAAVRERAALRASDWSLQLKELAGTAEYGVHVVDPRLPEAARDVRPASGGSGRGYLEALAAGGTERARRTEEGTRVAGQVESAIRSHVLRSRIDPLETAHGLVSIVFLVRRADADQYQAGLTRAVETHSDLRFLTSGPWPPYS
ncbi:MAG: GvpL/GvpF family gas vesicle protein, partial [Longimicrobiales bacterium]